MRQPPFVTEVLVEVVAVGVKDIFSFLQSIGDSQYAIYGVDGHREQPDRGGVLPEQHQQVIAEPQSERDGAHIAGKAAGLIPEIEKIEDEKGNGEQDQRGIPVRVGQGGSGGQQENGDQQAVQAGDAVDAVHEIEGIEEACEQDEGG